MNLYLIRGLPGSGKSTFAKSLKCMNIESDMFFCQNGEYKYSTVLSYVSHKWCQDTTEWHMQENLDISVSNTFTTKKEMEPYFLLAQKYDYKIIIYCMRNNYGSIHNVPKEIIDIMEQRWEDIEGEIVVTNNVKIFQGKKEK